PDVAGGFVHKITGFVEMAAGDQTDAMPPDQPHQPEARSRLDRPVAGIALLRTVEEQRAVEKPGEAPPSGLAHDGLEPAGLRRLGGLAAAEQQRVEADQAIARNFLDPAVGAEMAMPAPQPLVTDRLG